MHARVLALVCSLLAACQCGPTVTSTRGVLTVSPASFDFGTVNSGTAVTANLTLTNEGAANLGVSTAELRADARGAFSTGALPATLRSGETATLRVVYTPSTEGPDVATLVLTTDSTATPEVLVSLAGRSCATGSCPSIDAGAGDAGAGDAGLDAGAQDAGAVDGGAADAGPDAGAPDAGVVDAGTPDAGEPDAGRLVVFTTSLGFRGDLLGVAYADVFCSGVGQDAGLGTSFVAILRDSSQTLSARLRGTGPWYRADGQLAFATKADVLTGVPLVPLNLDEHGRALTGWGRAWTGAGPGGAAAANCSNWTDGAPGSVGASGSTSSTTTTWRDEACGLNCGNACDTTNHLYCLQW